MSCWNSGIFKGLFKLQLFIKTENPGAQLYFSSILYLGGSFPPWNVSWVAKCGNFVPECSGMLGSGIRDRGLKGKKWENQNRAEHPLEIREFWFYCRGIDRTHGIPAFSHIHGRVVWEKCQRPLLQGRLMTLKFVIEICTSL